jgi:aspartate kinase
MASSIVDDFQLKMTSAQPDQPDFYATVDLLRNEHINAARQSIRHQDILNALEEEVERDCEWLRNFLGALQVIGEISSKSQDTIVGLGERMACKLMAAILRDQVS